MKKRFLILIFVFLFLINTVPTVTAGGKELYWYCKRNTEHKQPISDPIFSFLESAGGIYVDKSHGDENGEKVIYLTFDAGYENGNVAKILDVLKEEGVCGSFFILENVIKRNPELVLRMADEGHIVCNHTLSHTNLVGSSEDEFRDEVLGLEKMYFDLTGREMAKFFRPPKGSFDKEMLLRAKSLGYKTVFWSFAYADWDNGKQPSEMDALKKILDNVHNGEIMLLHPTSETNARIMSELIRTLKEQGYSFSTLDKIE